MAIKEEFSGGILGYLAGALIDFLLSKKNKKVPEKSLKQLKLDMHKKLESRYKSDPEFKELVDDLMAGKQVV